MTIDRIFKGLTWRIAALGLFVAVLLGLLVFRMWYVQLRLGSNHQKSISKQSIRRIRIAPIRGRLMSIDGKALTDNIPSHAVEFHLHELRRNRPAGRTLALELFAAVNNTAQLIGRKSQPTLKDVIRHLHVYPALPFSAFADLDNRELAILYEQIPRPVGLEISSSMRRTYPFADVGAHLIGFVGNRDPNEEEERSEFSYFLPELTGRSGIEKLYDAELRGQGGAMLVRVDSLGFFYEDLSNVQPAYPGSDIVLSIDSRAQTIAQRLLDGKKGALVVVDTESGAVLALVSSPSYNLNGISAAYYRDLAQDRDGRPLFNRALSGSYAPGSILKPLVALALLQEGIYRPDASHHCPGYATIGNGRIGCSHHRLAAGDVNVVEALEQSCNSYFIDGGLKLGLDRLAVYLHAAGIGQDPGLEIKTRGSSGLLPSRRLKFRRLRESWNAFDTGLVSIGQGMIGLSPLQAAIYTAAIANGGRVYRASIVHGIRSPSGHMTKVFEPQVMTHLHASAEILAIVRQGMERVVHSKQGSGRSARSKAIALAGKTGTAEVGSRRARRNNTWFICYGPLKAPRYALAIIVENGVSGGKTAAPLAREFFKQYLRAIAVAEAGLDYRNSLSIVDSP